MKITPSQCISKEADIDILNTGTGNECTSYKCSLRLKLFPKLAATS